MRLAGGVAALAPSAYAQIFGKPTATSAVRQVTAASTAYVILLSTTEMAHGLKAAELPVSGIAEMMAVERKTVYSWLDGTEARNAKLSRLETLYNLLCQESPGALKWFHRHWDRSLEGGYTLHALLTAEVIDVGRVRRALDVLRPAVIRAMERERKRTAEGNVDSGPPGLMNMHLTATASL
jgi:hypothetical protein